MTSDPSPRRDEIVEAAYAYVLEHGLVGASLRPVADAVGSSTGVLRFLFGSKDGLIRAILDRARVDELALLDAVRSSGDLAATAERIWQWLRDPAHRAVLALWVESYATSLQDPDGAWGSFASSTVEDWLGVLARSQPSSVRHTAAGRAQRSAVLAVLRGAMLDLLATGDRTRTTRAVRGYLAGLTSDGSTAS